MLKGGVAEIQIPLVHVSEKKTVLDNGLAMGDARLLVYTGAAPNVSALARAKG